MGEFIEEHARRASKSAFGGAATSRTRRSRDRDAAIAAILPHLRGAVSSNRRMVGALGRLGRSARRLPTARGPRICARSARAAPITSCARASRRCSCRGIRRRDDADLLRRVDERLAVYRADYARVLHRRTRSPTRRRMRDTQPVGGRHSRRSASSVLARTNAKRGSPPSSSSTRFT